MTTAPLRSPSISERLYTALLWLYPAKFRKAYGREMMQMFRDCYREEKRDSGSGVRLWSLVLSDLTTSVCIEHWKASMTFFRSLFGLEEEILMANALLNLDVALRTDIGKRPTNEDNMSSYVPEDPEVMARKGALFVVADGMGGHAYGEVASELAVNAIRDAYYQDAEEDIALALRKAVEHANTVIWKRNDEKFRDAEDTVNAKQIGMATTCVAAVLRGDRVYVANVGDSLAYVIRAGQVLQIAENHSWVAEQVREGLLTREQARTHEKRNVITRCLGTKAHEDIYVAVETVQNGDILALCTDGLWSLIEENELRSILEQYEPEESAKRLVERANENGGPDNITAVVVHVSLAA